MKPFEEGDIFLGLDQLDREIGVRTDRHAITIAGSGAGKGTSVIIPNLKRWPHSALVIDPKGENARVTYADRMAMGQTVHVIDPFETEGIPAQIRSTFNPLSMLDPESLTGGSDLSSLGASLIKKSNPEHAQWDDTAGEILAGIIGFVVADAPEELQTLSKAREVLMQSNDELLEDAGHMQASDAFDGVVQHGGKLIEAALTSEKGIEKDALNQARQQTKWLGMRAFKNVLASTSFDLKDIANGKTTVFLVLPSDLLDEHGAFLKLFVQASLKVMLKAGTEHSNKCLFILDEFYSLGKMDSIMKGFGLMRGYGVQIWPILQDIGQLFSTYGDKGTATFFGNSDLHQFFGNSDRPTLEHMSFATGIIGVDEIGDAPDTPTITGGSPSVLGAMTAQSKDSTMRGMGAMFGAMSGGIDQAIAASQNAKHQNEMNAYQQKMATLGRARKTPEEMAKLVQCKDDVVADNMFCITYGADKILVKPAPYFRKIEVPEPPPEKPKRDWNII